MNWESLNAKLSQNFYLDTSIQGMFEVEDFARRCRLAPASFHEGSRPARDNWLISAPASFSLYLAFPSIPLCLLLPSTEKCS